MLESFKIESYHESLNDIIDVLKPIKEYYPNYENWIENVVQSGLLNNTRKIRVLKNDGNIAGLSILKDTPDEKKICSLFIHPEYRGESWMYSIFSDSLMYLKTKKPVITIPSTIMAILHIGLIMLYYTQHEDHFFPASISLLKQTSAIFYATILLFFTK